MKKGTILLTGDFDLAERHKSDQVIHVREPKSDDDIADHLEHVEHYIVGGPEYIHADLMKAAPRLQQIVVMGTGTSSFVDLKAAEERGISVENTPHLNADAVAEFVVGALIFSLANGFHSSRRLLEGGWYQKPHKTLSETTIGIIGAGNIGQRVGKKLRRLSTAELSYYSRSAHREFERDCGASFVDLKTMFQTSDAIILNVAYNSETHNIIDEKLLRLSKPGAILLNFSNPLTIDPLALKEGLERGAPAFAFYDGYYNEWVANKGQGADAHKLLSLGNDKFVATSHIAAQSHAVIADIVDEAFTKIANWRPQRPLEGRHSFLQATELYMRDIK